MARFSPKRLPDGRAMLNLGCGWKMHRDWTNLDFSPYARLARKPWLVRILTTAGLINETRRARLAALDPEMVCWDLRRGIPYADCTFDVVYHSHFLEHLDKEVARVVLEECHRVLKPEGIIRVVVPDWGYLTQRYLEALRSIESGDPLGRELHTRAMHDLIDQMVRTRASGRARNGLAGWLEERVRGGAAQTGEVHRWMYDRHSLGWLLVESGFCQPQTENATTSRIARWAEFKLDVNEDGSDYKPESLYVEAIRPTR